MLITARPADFNPRSPRGERRSNNRVQGWLDIFQSTLPARGATANNAAGDFYITISIHAPREGSDFTLPLAMSWIQDFNPRSPRGERPQTLITVSLVSHFNPRSPRGERLSARYIVRRLTPFQSTLPARGATRPFSLRCPRCRHFNPRSPRGERRGSTRSVCARRNFNPRSPRGERQGAYVNRMMSERFQSTLPARGATDTFLYARPRILISIHAPREGSDGRSLGRQGLVQRISIHAPREGSDWGVRVQHFRWVDFNPRSPRGERPVGRRKGAGQWIFQSTLPARGATIPPLFFGSGYVFQSTLPARGATCGSCSARKLRQNFNPRSPRGERRMMWCSGRKA